MFRQNIVGMQFYPKETAHGEWRKVFFELFVKFTQRKKIMSHKRQDVPALLPGVGATILRRLDEEVSLSKSETL